LKAEEAPYVIADSFHALFMSFSNARGRSHLSPHLFGLVADGRIIFYPGRILFADRDVGILKGCNGCLKLALE